MNGAGHYAEAEKLDKMATETGTFEMALVLATRAQVHATLALAAATAEAAPISPDSGPLVQRPTEEGVGFPGAPAYPGSPWGQVLA